MSRERVVHEGDCHARILYEQREWVAKGSARSQNEWSMSAFFGYGFFYAGSGPA